MNHLLGRLKKFVMRRQRLMGLLILLLFNVLFHVMNVHNQDGSQKFYSNVPAPSRFFPENSSVLDFPFGNEDVLASLRHERDVFVMLYAPWSVHCVYAREHFAAASSSFQNKVYFVAINCWHNGGICRQKHNLITFQTFYYYKQDFEGFRYNGIPRSDLIVHFVELMMDPIEVIKSKEHLMTFLTRHETSVISYFNFASSYEPSGFDQFYKASLKFIEADAMNVLRCGITTSSLVASLIHLHSVSSISLIKDTKCVNTYALQSNTSYEDIFQWINNNRGEPSMKWLHLSKKKSLVLSNELKKGPALLLFLPFYPLSLQHEAFFEMHKVSLAYYRCNETEPIWNVFFEKFFKNNINHTNALQASCNNQKLHIPCDISENVLEVCCMFVIDIGTDICLEAQGKNSTLSSCHLFTANDNLYKRLSGLYIKADNRNETSICFEMQLSYVAESIITICNSKKKHSDFGRVIRNRNTEAYEESKANEDSVICSAWENYFSVGWRHENHSSKVALSGYTYPSGFIGSGCHNNHSIRFYMLDFFENDAFIVNLGFPQLASPTLLYTDVKREILYKFDEHISESSIVHFMMLHHKSNSVSSHFRNEVFQKKASSIVQLTSSNFNELVLNRRKPILVLYYSKWCGFCSTFYHIYVSIVTQSSSLSDLSFARIDADSNDISQQYSSPYYPSVVLFTRDNNSIPYSKDNPRSFSSLMKFVLHHAVVKPHISSSACNKECMKRNMIKLRKKLTMINIRLGLVNYILSKDVLDVQERRCFEVELCRNQIQMEAARFLFKVLQLPTSGKFLEMHKLSFLSKKQILFRTKLKTLPRCH